MSYIFLECETCDEDFYVCEHIHTAMKQRGHVADFNGDDWSLEHPLACREYSLLDCPMNDILKSCVPGSDRPTHGRYKVTIVDEDIDFEAL